MGLISLHIKSIKRTAAEAEPQQSSPSKLQKVAEQGVLAKTELLREYSDCFDKIGKFPGEKYRIQLIEDAKPVVHPPRTVPVHILPLYKAELDKMLADGVISPVTEPTDCVNSIVSSEDVFQRKLGEAY